ncbi:MAG: cell wall-binding repeat-containing protein [Lachnospiraceae bacterium]|nr:cell wall-binding repeat-containing protein [Lachnospiraceae bacterium]
MFRKKLMAVMLLLSMVISLFAGALTAAADSGEAIDTAANTQRFFSSSNMVRSSGKTRYETALQTAEKLKTALNVSRFDTIIVACGDKFPDALAASFLAAKRQAPIIIVGATGSGQDKVAEFIGSSLAEGGQVYILGGTGAVPESTETLLRSVASNVRRLSGKSRFETNLSILAEAGTDGESTLLISNGGNYADALSASALGKPILLVDKDRKALTAEQSAFVSGSSFDKFVILGGTGSVPAEYEGIFSSLKSGAEVTRIGGKTRYETSVNIAKQFFTAPSAVTVATGEAFPDGLTGGSLAYALGSPLILTNTGANVYALASAYADENTIGNILILGGTGRIPDEVAKAIVSESTGPDEPAEQKPVVIHVMDMEEAALDDPTDEMLQIPYKDKIEEGDLIVEKAAAKGLNGTSAIRYTQSNPGWATLFNIRWDVIPEHTTDLSGTHIFWFWIDLSSIGGTVKLETYLINYDYNDLYMKEDADFYLWSGGDVVTSKTVHAWDGGGDYGRMPMPERYKGFVGLPYASFNENTGMKSDGTRFDRSCLRGLHVYIPNVSKGSTAYIDDFWATDIDSLPDVEIAPEPLRIQVMDMESKVLDNTPEYEKVYFSWGSSSSPVDSGISLAKVEGKGLNGSAAIEYELLSTTEKPVTIRMDAIDEYPTDLSGTDVFWFWMDASGINRDFKLEPRLLSTDWKYHKLQIGKEYFTWTGGDPVTAVTVEAWSGQSFGRLSLPAKFKGFVGIPFDAFYKGGGDSYAETDFAIDDIKGMLFNLPNPKVSETICFDEFWATEAGQLPNVTIDPEPEQPEGSVRIHVMDMENAALNNPTGEMLQYPWGGGGTDVTLSKVAGKGFNGSAAIEYKMLTTQEKIVRIRMDQIAAYPTDLTGADIFWLWIDTTGVNRALNLELQLYSTSWKDYDLKIGETFYLWEGGASVAEAITVDAWNGIKGRTPLPQNFVGFIGVPFSAFYEKAEDGSDNAWSIDDIKGIRFDLPNPVAGEALYIDEFWATETGQFPDVTFNN